MTGFPDDHVIMQSARVELEWDGERWVISDPDSAGPRLIADPDGVVCNYGLHLDDPAMRERCAEERNRAAVAPVPSRKMVATVFSPRWEQ